MSNLSELKPVGSISPFKKFCCTIGNLPSSYMASFTYEEQLLWLCDYLQNTVIPAVNTNAEAVAELQGLYIELKDYVDHYFDNLDVQNEINNKLDEMAENGTLEKVFSSYFKNFEIKQQENFNNYKQEINNVLNAQDNKINQLVSATPSVVNSKEEMTDTNKIYILSTDNNWYYYKGTWISGGVYQGNSISNNSIPFSKLDNQLFNNIQNSITLDTFKKRKL